MALEQLVAEASSSDCVRGWQLADTNHDWPFLDPPNTAVLTNIRILEGEDWVQYVTHDEEDGAWQFHPPSGQASMKEAAVTSLQRIVAIEPRIMELADLLLGWHAWRDSENADWMSAPKKR